MKVPSGDTHPSPVGDGRFLHPLFELNWLQNLAPALGAANFFLSLAGPWEAGLFIAPLSMFSAIFMMLGV